jgi:hypothetical protein
MNFEGQPKAVKVEGEEKQKVFEANEARVAAIGSEVAAAVESGDYAKVAELAAEAKELKSANESLYDSDRQEAAEMNADFDAEKARAEAERAAEEARRAQQAAEQVAADQARLEELAASIKNRTNEESALTIEQKNIEADRLNYQNELENRFGTTEDLMRRDAEEENFLRVQRKSNQMGYDRQAQYINQRRPWYKKMFGVGKIKAEDLSREDAESEK